MDYKDYYKILGVNPADNEEVIRTAYKKLAVKYHPDKNPGNKEAEARFKEVSEAKEVLLDPDNRQKYDALRQQYEYRKQQVRNQQFRRNQSYQQVVDEADEGLGGVFGSFWQEVFGGSRGPQRGKNLQANFKISLREAYQGLSTILSFEGRRLRIKIKPGIKSGKVLIIKKQGAPGKNGGEAGDLHLEVIVKEDEQFIREGNNLLTTLRVPITAAVLGRKVKVETLKGKVSMQIPAGTQSGEKLKLRKLGMPVYDSSDSFGDLLVLIQVIIPKRLSEEEKKLFQALESKGL